MSDLDERLARALDEAVPRPPRELDPESLRAAGRGRRRRSLTPALAAAAIVVVAVGVGIVRHHHAAPDSAPAGSPRGITAQAVARLLAAAPTVPGATQVDHSPVTPPVTPPVGPVAEPGSPNVVRRTHWWTAPGSMDAAIAFFTAHPPNGTEKRGSASSSNHGVTTGEGVTFEPTDRRWLNPTAYTSLELQVAVAPAPGGVAVLVEADAIWLPARTAAERIPGNVTSVHVVVDRKESAPAAHRTLGAPDARSLAALVDRQGVVVPGEMHCPVDLGWTDTLTFRSPAGDVVVTAEPGGCAYVTVGPRSAHNPTLGGGLTVDRAVLRALGLPRNYGR